MNNSDHDQAFTTLLETATKCNVHLNYDKLQYKMWEIDFFGETYTAHGHKPTQTKVFAITEIPPSLEEASPVIHWHDYLPFKVLNEIVRA